MTMLDEIIELTSELIRFKSTHARPEEIAACAQYILKWCESHEIRAEFMEHNGVPSIAIMPEAGKRAKVMLMSHIDVVAAEDDQFTPRVEGDKLFGRGSGDDKYAAALSLILFRDRLNALRAKGLGQKDMSLAVLITGDEEVGGPNGAAYALTKVQADYVVAVDGGTPERMVVKEKGIINMKITAHGAAAHGARPWLGENAIEALYRDYEALKGLFTEEREGHWNRTVNFGIVKAGESINQVPDVAEGQFNIRYTELDDPEALVEDIKKAVKGDVEVFRIDPVFASPASKYTDRLLELSGAEAVFEHGASDARFLDVNGMVGIVWGAKVYSIHAPAEAVSISSIGKLTDMLNEFLNELDK